MHVTSKGSAADLLTPGAAGLPGSGIRQVMDLVVGRSDVLRLEIGEPDFLTPAHIVEAAVAGARRGVRYTQTAGLLQLREALAEKLLRVNGLEYGPDQILVTQGAVEGIAALFAALLEPGDEVLLPDPAWPNFEMLALIHGARPLRYGLHPSTGFHPELAEIAEQLGPRTKLLVLNSPSNPTGTVLDATEVAAIVETAAGNGTVVLADEVYDELVFSGRPTAAAGFAPDWVVGAYSFSKTYAMTGWRVGYLAAPTSLATALTRVQEPFISCVSEVSQVAALAALDGPQECVGEMRDAYRRRRDLVVSLLRSAGIAVRPPAGAFYLMVPLAPGADSQAAALSLVEAGVAVAPGSAFGRVGADHLRVSLATSEAVLEEAVERLLRWYQGNDGGRGVA